MSCGIQGCLECEAETLVLPMIGEMGHPSFLDGHFVLPDTNVFLSQVESAEYDLFLFLSNIN